MKHCPKCNTTKSKAEFGRNSSKKDGLQSYCKVCRNDYLRLWYYTNQDTQKQRVYLPNKAIKNRNKSYIDKYLSDHPCVDCGNPDIRVLEFDHVRGKKLFNISDSVSQKYSLDKIESEIAKCEVRCANCHRIATHERRCGDKPW